MIKRPGVLYFYLVTAVFQLASAIHCAAQVTAQPAESVAAGSSVVPRAMRLNGVAANRAGDTLEAVFRIYAEPEGGEPVWSETQRITVDRDGNYSALLGAATAGGLPESLFVDGKPRWLGVSMERAPEQTRIALVSVAYAMKAADAETLAGVPAAEFVTQAQLKKSSAEFGVAPSTLAANARAQASQAHPEVSPTGSGVANTIPLWNTATTLSSSILTQSATAVTAKGSLNATSSTTAAAVSGANAGTKGTAPCVSLTGVHSANCATAVSGIESAKTSQTYGVFGESNSTATLSAGVAGLSNAATGQVYGVAGASLSSTSSAAGVGGVNLATKGSVFGVSGLAVSPSGVGVAGYEAAKTGVVFGVTGGTASTTTFAAGVSGSETAATGRVFGVAGSAASSTTNAMGVSGYESAVSGQVYGVDGYTASAGPSAAGVGGFEGAATGVVFGVVGGASSATDGAAGVNGSESSATGAVYGVSGAAGSTSANAAGVRGTEYATTGVVFGVNGTAASTTENAAGVNGVENALTGQVYGVNGFTASTTDGATGVNGMEGGATGQVFGVFGNAISTGTYSAGVIGSEAAATGQVFGVSGQASSTTAGASGVSGYEPATTGQVYGVSGYASSPSGSGVLGTNSATSGFATGVTGITASPNGAGVYGFSNAASGGIGVNGNAPASGTAIQGGNQDCSSGVCKFVSGTALALSTGNGGTLISASSASVGTATSDGGTQQFSVDSSGNGFFAGNLNVTGTLSKGSGSFKIDHPLDPANKFLSHSFVESPDMMNVYNGNIVTDKHGVATVTLPEYFEALNRDFRYQLTVIGQFAQAIVAEKISGNRFIIRTSKPRVEVSWQVTGIRQDAYANANRIPVEEDKPDAQRGYYLHPEVFGQPAAKALAAAKSPVLQPAAAEAGTR